MSFWKLWKPLFAALVRVARDTFPVWYVVTGTALLVLARSTGWVWPETYGTLLLGFVIFWATCIFIGGPALYWYFIFSYCRSRRTARGW